MLNLFSLWAIPVFIFGVLVSGELKGVKVYEAFIRGAEEGLKTGVRLFPFFLAIFGALAVFRSSGALNLICRIISPCANLLGIPPEVIPLGLLKPISGTGALGYLAELVERYGPDSRIGAIACVVGGSTETTFYVLTIYLGAVGITNPKQTIAMGIAADLCSFIVAVFAAKLLF